MIQVFMHIYYTTLNRKSQVKKIFLNKSIFLKKGIDFLKLKWYTITTVRNSERSERQAKMNKTHGSRKRDIEMFVKIEIAKGNIKRAIDLCEMYGISSKDFGRLVREVEQVG